MGADDISFEDLLEEAPHLPARPACSLRQLLWEGFPPDGGLAALAAIGTLSDPDPRMSEVRHAYLQILEAQRRGSKPAA